MTVRAASTAPRLRHEWTFLAQVATDIHAKRAATYPARVANGRMTSIEAEAALAAIAAIAEDWRAAVASGVPSTGSLRPTRRSRIATLTTARDRAAALADKAATAYRDVLPKGASLPDRDVLLIDHAEGRTMSSAAEAWVRAVDYAAAVVAMLWWEEGRGGRLDMVCTINAEQRASRLVVEAQAA